MRVPAYQSHPGGQPLLRCAREADRADLLFLSYHAGCDWAKIERECARRAVDAPERGDAYRELDAVVRAVRAAHGARERVVHEAYCLAVTVALPAAYACHLAAPTLANTAALSALFATYFLNVFHVRHHRDGRVFRAPALHRATAPLHDALDNTFGIHVACWTRSHNARHHVHTHDAARDPDVRITCELLRLVPEAPRRWFHAAQSWYCVALFATVVGLYPWTNAFVKTPRGDRRHLALWLALCVALPAARHGAVGLAWMAGMYAATSLALAYLFTVSHNSAGLAAPGGGGRARDTAAVGVDGWLAHQVHAAVSWGGYASTLVCGGLNLQVEHHLAPACTPTLYHHMRPHVAAMCARRGWRYVWYPSLYGAARAMHRRLRDLGAVERTG